MSTYRKGIGEARAYHTFSSAGAWALEPDELAKNLDDLEALEQYAHGEHDQVRAVREHIAAIDAQLANLREAHRNESDGLDNWRRRAEQAEADFADAVGAAVLRAEAAEAQLGQDREAFAEAEHEIHRLEDALGAMGMHVAGIHEAPSQYDGLSGRPCTMRACIAKRVAEIAR